MEELGVPVAGGHLLNWLHVSDFSGLLLNRRCKRGLRSGGLLSCLGGERLIDNACFFAQEVFDVVTTAHARCSDLFVEQAVCHGGDAHSGGRSTVFAEEERLSAAFGTSLLGAGWQSEWRLAGALTDEHFDVIAIRHTG